MLVRQQITGLTARADQLESAASPLDAERDVLAKERDALKAALTKAGQRSGFAVLPYKGPNGTWRRPIVLECTSGGVKLQPKGLTFTAMDLSPLINPRSSPLIRAIAHEMLHIQASDTPDGAAAVPYLVFLVRPGGIRHLLRGPHVPRAAGYRLRLRADRARPGGRYPRLRQPGDLGRLGASGHAPGARPSAEGERGHDLLGKPGWERFNAGFLRPSAGRSRVTIRLAGTTNLRTPRRLGHRRCGQQQSRGFRLAGPRPGDGGRRIRRCRSPPERRTNRGEWDGPRRSNGERRSACRSRAAVLRAGLPAISRRHPAASGWTPRAAQPARIGRVASSAVVPDRALSPQGDGSLPGSPLRPSEDRSGPGGTGEVNTLPDLEPAGDGGSPPLQSRLGLSAQNAFSSKLGTGAYRPE